MATPWSYFNKFKEYTSIYLPSNGEGDTMATQAVTAITKLIYKWYNDGDVYDNTYQLNGWANDLSSYANWLYTYIPETQTILDKISEISDDDDYEDLILRPLADIIFDANYLKYLNTFAEKKGSIYDCTGPFEFDDSCDEDEYDEDEYDDEYEDEFDDHESGEDW